MFLFYFHRRLEISTDVRLKKTFDYNEWKNRSCRTVNDKKRKNAKKWSVLIQDFTYLPYCVFSMKFYVILKLKIINHQIIVCLA